MRRPRTRPLRQAGHWEHFAATAIGADHLRSGSPAQDAVAAERFGPRNSMLVLAVADGHGHARHFRSDRGAAMAVAAGTAAAKQWALSLPADTPVSGTAASILVADVLARWRHAVAADLARDPVGSAHAGVMMPGDPAEIPYGSTLLLAVIRPDAAVFAQIGDGDILLVRPDGRYLTPVPDDSRLDGTQTTSLCQPDAESSFRIGLATTAKTPIYAIFAATDGYGNAQADEGWRQRWAADIVRLASERGPHWLGAQLQDWVTLCASSAGSGDDTTAALAVNTAVAALPGGQPAAGPQSPDPARMPAMTSGRLWAAGVATLAVLALVVYLWPGTPHHRPQGVTSSRSASPSPSGISSPTPTPSGSPSGTHSPVPSPAQSSAGQQNSSGSGGSSSLSSPTPSPTAKKKKKNAPGMVFAGMVAE